MPSLPKSTVTRRIKKEYIETEFHNAASGVQSAQFTLQNFKSNLEVEVLSVNDKSPSRAADETTTTSCKSIEFELRNINIKLVNALRRILIAETANMAIHRVYMRQNSSFVDDHNLVHRLAMLPLDIDPTQFEEFPLDEDAGSGSGGGDDAHCATTNPAAFKLPATDEQLDTQLDPKKCVVFSLHRKFSADFPEDVANQCLAEFPVAQHPSEHRAVAAYWARQRIECEAEGGRRLQHCTVYSRDLRWVPLTPRKTDNVAPSANDATPPPPRPVTNNVILSKLGRGQEIKLGALAIKGFGRTHAKFNCVSCAAPRPRPRLSLPAPTAYDAIRGEDARLLCSLFPRGVIALQNCGGRDDVVAVVGDERAMRQTCTDFLEHERLRNRVELRLDESHMLFRVESELARARPCHVILLEACQTMMAKCDHYLALQLIKEEEARQSVKKAENQVEGEENAAANQKQQSIKDGGGGGGGAAASRFMFGRRVWMSEEAIAGGDERERVFVFHGEDETLGTTLAFAINELQNVEYCGIAESHPMEDRLNISVCAAANSTAKQVMTQGLRDLKKLYNIIRSKLAKQFKLVIGAAPSDDPADNDADDDDKDVVGGGGMTSEPQTQQQQQTEMTSPRSKRRSSGKAKMKRESTQQMEIDQ